MCDTAEGPGAILSLFSGSPHGLDLPYDSAIAHPPVPKRKSGELVSPRHELSDLRATSSHLQRIQSLSPDRYHVFPPRVGHMHDAGSDRHRIGFLFVNDGAESTTTFESELGSRFPFQGERGCSVTFE